jgi:hypothetical protein
MVNEMNPQMTQSIANVVFAGTFKGEIGEAGIINEAGFKINRWLETMGSRVGPHGRREEFGFREFGFGILPGADKESAMPEGYIVNIWGPAGLAGQATVVRTPTNEFMLTIVEYPAAMRPGETRSSK